MSPMSWGLAIKAAKRRSMTISFRKKEISSFGSDGEALAAAAGALGVGIVEREAGGEIVLAPVHHRSDQIEHARAVDVKCSGGRLDLLIERLFLGHIIDRISEAGAAAARRRQLDPDRPFRRLGHQLGDARLRSFGQRDRGGPRAQFSFLVHSIPNSNRASSLIFDGSHGGSQTRLTTASRIPGTDSTRSSTSCGSDSATGQCGVIRVMVTVASPSSEMSTS